MKTVALVFARVLTALAFATALVFTVYFLVKALILPAVSTAALAAILGYFVYRDLRRFIESRRTSKAPS